MKDDDAILVEGKLRNAFSDSSSMLDTNIHELVRHLARMAAENDYKKLLKTGKIPYSFPKKKENNYD